LVTTCQQRRRRRHIPHNVYARITRICRLPPHLTTSAEEMARSLLAAATAVLATAAVPADIVTSLVSSGSPARLAVRGHAVRVPAVALHGAGSGARRALHVTLCMTQLRAAAPPRPRSLLSPAQRRRTNDARTHASPCSCLAARLRRPSDEDVLGLPHGPRRVRCCVMALNALELLSIATFALPSTHMA